MTTPVKLNLKVYQGSTFKEVLRWETSTKAYAPISAISKSAPIVITAIGHSIPVGWRTKVTNVLGMKEINSQEVYQIVTSADTDNVTFNSVNALAFSDYISGGVLEYNLPSSLLGVTARMHIRDKIESVDTIDILTTENGGIIIDPANYTITIHIPASKTTLYTFSSAVYSMELVNGAEVTPFINGNVTLVKEVTR